MMEFVQSVNVGKLDYFHVLNMGPSYELTKLISIMPSFERITCINNMENEILILIAGKSCLENPLEEVKLMGSRPFQIATFEQFLKRSFFKNDAIIWAKLDVTPADFEKFLGKIGEFQAFKGCTCQFQYHLKTGVKIINENNGNNKIILKMILNTQLHDHDL
uniref:DUF38 domain-containing protein n=1 Tax=Panagrolaimus sp. JU765 TaxID=591449 RepID=A0AC34QXC5_9BILA